MSRVLKFNDAVRNLNRGNVQKKVANATLPVLNQLDLFDSRHNDFVVKLMSKRKKQSNAN